MSKAKAIEQLKGIINKGDTIYYIVKQVSNSGAYRHLDFHKFDIKDEFREGEDRIVKYWLTRLMCDALEYKFKDKTSCMGVSGGGMDMGFHVIYQLSHLLYGDGYALKYRQL